MTGPRDSRAIKLLADILALVLAEESGEATAALAAVRRRAARDGVTGGALKALFQQLHPQAFPAPVAPREGMRRTEDLRAAVTDLQHRLAEARLLLERERRENEALRRRVEAALPPRGENHAAEAARLRIRVHELERRLTRDKLLSAPARPPASRPAASPASRGGRWGHALKIASLLLAAGLAADHPPQPSPSPARQATGARPTPVRPTLVSL